MMSMQSPSRPGHPFPTVLQAPSVRRGALVVTHAGTINVNDFKTGVTVEIDGVPYRVLGAFRRVHSARCGGWQQ